ncbi:uncharacterized protein PHACADRAFT_197940 [Phanerochaete carnosa HHB-10118-sp]|nr:uncharacterized protein PHACADRAFT_197940 [Phanerochaete carnosa HHB-10118-sp]EKM53511.1 hypothetical protein PHACADRAFT_197940 [Phanerochaete carnosa HHB-10118-sp]
MSPPTLEDIRKLVQELTDLAPALPESVPLAKKTDRISKILASTQGEDEFHTFNRRYNALFGVDCRIGPRMRYVTRGKYGMLAWCEYIRSIKLDDPSMQSAVVELRLKSLIKELEFLV